MTEQNANRLGRQCPEPNPEPDGTRKWWWNRTPQEYREANPVALRRTRRNQKMMMEQNAKRLENPFTFKAVWGKVMMEWWNKDCFLEELRTPFSSRAVWGKRKGSMSNKIKLRSQIEYMSFENTFKNIYILLLFLLISIQEYLQNI